TEMIEPFSERIEGRYSKETIRHPETDEVIVRPDELVTAEIAKKITDAGIEEMYIRSAFTCNTRDGVCEKCYGKNLATGEKVEVVEEVETIAAQEIGEPGTQLTISTLDTGAEAGSEITQSHSRSQDAFDTRIDE